ncbi:hypothetical protein SUGI_0589490 [Cryptomeria japonica]|nr:hypothetical protein SUGI_0589490 [Cryptomeria japonica]
MRLGRDVENNNGIEIPTFSLPIVAWCVGSPAVAPVHTPPLHFIALPLRGVWWEKTVQTASKTLRAIWCGKWDDSMYFVLGDVTSKPKGYDPMSEACLLWKRNKPSSNNSRYSLTPFATALNELTPDLKQKLPPTDSRLRPDQ